MDKFNSFNSLHVLTNILLLNLIDLYIYDFQILDSFSINEFARKGAQCSNLHGITSAELFEFG